MASAPILVAVDFSKFSRAALDAAIALAQDHDQSIILIHVRRQVAADHGHPSPLQQVELELQLTESVDLTTQWAARARKAGVDVEVLTPAGHPADEILQAARELQVALIAIGTRGRTGLKRLVLGSVAEAIVRGSDRPVLVVPSG